MICSKNFLEHFMMIHKFTKLVFVGRWKFRHVRTIANFAIEEIDYWVVGIWREMLLTILIFFKAKNDILWTLNID